jgi:CO dehydrogenase maturation factor
MAKIAISGKGGVGKTTVTAGLARALGRRGYRVIALDMDPSPNLLGSLGCDLSFEEVRPLMEMEELIAERTGAPPGGYGAVFKLNPKVDDLLTRFGVRCRDGVELLVLGRIQRGGGGCFCPANNLAKRLIDHLSGVADFLLMDMEAGVEHLGRGTTRTVELLLVVVEPSLKSLAATRHILELARDLEVSRLYALLNKVRSPREEALLAKELKRLGIPLLHTLPLYPDLAEAELQAGSPLDTPVGQPLAHELERAAMKLANVLGTMPREVGG